jgi:hypothetical protein
MKMKVQIQVVKTYEIEVPGNEKEAIETAYDMQSTEIEEKGKMTGVFTEYAEIVKGD